MSVGVMWHAMLVCSKDIMLYLTHCYGSCIQSDGVWCTAGMEEKKQQSFSADCLCCSMCLQGNVPAVYICA